MSVYSWIFIVVFGVAFVAAVTSAICKRSYEKKIIRFFSKADSYTPEEKSTIKKMLRESSEDLGIDVFELMEDEKE